MENVVENELTRDRILIFLFQLMSSIPRHYWDYILSIMVWIIQKLLETVVNAIPCLSLFVDCMTTSHNTTMNWALKHFTQCHEKRELKKAWSRSVINNSRVFGLHWEHRTYIWVSKWSSGYCDFIFVFVNACSNLALDDDLHEAAWKEIIELQTPIHLVNNSL